MKEKAEEKIAREMQIERRKEAEKCFQRWILELRAREATKRASVPRGAIGERTSACLDLVSLKGVTFLGTVPKDCVATFLSFNILGYYHVSLKTVQGFSAEMSKYYKGQ